MQDNNQPPGYSEMMARLNQPDSWDTRGIICDLSKSLGSGNDGSAGELKASVDWMVTMLRKCRSAMADACVTDDVAEIVNRKLKGW